MAKNANTAEEEKAREAFDLEKLSSNPELWKRLATPKGTNGKMGNVFLSKENPFVKDPEKSMEKVKELAAEGKLYVREFGRSRHYQKVEQDEKGYKLGKQTEGKLSAPYDPILGSLVRMSQWYFRKLGLNKIADWFGKFADRYNSYRELKKNYKQEYKSLSKKEKKQLKKQRKAEKKALKAQKRLEKLQKETDAARKETAAAEKEMEQILKERKGLDKSNTPEKENAAPQKETMPQAENTQQKENVPQAENTQQKENALQVGNMQEHQVVPQVQNNQNLVIESNPVNIQTPAPQTKSNLQIENAQQIEFLGRKQENDRSVENQIAADRKLAEELQAEIQKAAEDQEKKPEKKPEPKKPLDLSNVDLTGNLDELDPEVLERVRELAGQIQTQGAPQPVKDVPVQNLEKGEMDAPLNNYPELDQDASFQPGRPKETEQPTMKEQLAQERESMRAAGMWKGTVANSLFHSEVNKDIRDEYEKYKNSEAASRDILAGAVSGIFGFGPEAQGGAKNYKKMLDTVLDGKPMDTSFNKNVREGMGIFDAAWDKMRQGDKEPMKEMLSNTVRELNKAASSESALSSRHVMIGKLISATMTMAQENNIKLNLSEKDMKAAVGAVNMAKVAERYGSARQYLGKENADLNSERGRNAVRDLLAGKAVEAGLGRDQMAKETISSTQVLMGSKLWSAEKMAEMTNTSTVRKKITPEQVKELMEQPNSALARKAGDRVLNHFIKESREVLGMKRNEPALDMENKKQKEQAKVAI